MEQDINISTERIQELLAQTFQQLAEKGEAQDVGEPKMEVESTSKPKVDDLTQASGADHPGTTCTIESPPTRPQSSNSSTKTVLPSISDTGNKAVVSLAEPCGAGLSIFDSTSEFIITGSELTSKTITLSTHSFHVMTRPTMISNSRYERNALLFSVGFLLRRAADPSPFRPLLSKLATTLQAMEEESRFLTSPKHRPKLQILLERVLLSLNSAEFECNLLLSRSNALHLKLYHPPKPETSLVHDHEVPILLRRDVQLQMYDWDLAINWVILHIDGITNARQISIKAEVDLEMVQACLRVLKHHGVIALVCPFSYSNHYEFTPKAAAMLAGKESKLLQDAYAYVWKRRTTTMNNTTKQQQSTSTNHNNLINNHPAGFVASPGSDGSHPTNNPVIGSPYSFFGFTPSSSSYPPRTAGLSVSHRGSRFVIAAAAHSLDKESSSGFSGKNTTTDDLRLFRSALAELYCACSRNLSFGDLWMALTIPSSDVPPPSGVLIPNLQQQQQQQHPRSSMNPFPSSSLSIRKGSISEEYPEEAPSQQFSLNVLEQLALSPTEVQNLAALRQTSKKSQDDASRWDWNDFMKRFDHRRFVTFGLIHGIITRIHCFPCFPYPFPNLSHKMESQQPSIPPSETTMVGQEGLNMDGKIDVSVSASVSARLEEYQLAKVAASLMDGTRCDDELSCALEIPFQRLVKMVETYSKRKVICLYAARSS